MSTDKSYDCAANIWWINFRWSPTPKVPLSIESVKRLQRSHFAQPRRMDKGVKVAVGSDLALNFGNLRCISPEEMLHAMLFAVRDAIVSGADEAVLRTVVKRARWVGRFMLWYTTERCFNPSFECRRWKTIMLSTTIVFELHDSMQSIFFKGVNLRNEIVSEYDALVRSATQRVYELMTFRAQLLQGGWELAGRSEKRKAISDEDLFQEWSRHGKEGESKSAEQVTLNFVQVAVTVYEKILSQGCLRDMVLKIDSTYDKQSPFTFITNLDLVAGRTKSVEQGAWMLRSIEHMLVTEQCTPKDFSKRTLAPAKQKGLLDLMLFKMDLLRHLMQSVLPAMVLPGTQKESLARLDSHQTWRDNTKNLAWTGALQESGRLFFTVLQTIIYGTAVDGGLRTTLKATSDVTEFLQQNNVVNDSIEEVLAKNRQEVGKPTDQEGDRNDPSRPVAVVITGNVSLTDLVSQQQIEKCSGTEGQSESLDQWFAYLNTKFEQFVSLVVDAGTATMSTTELSNLLSATILKDVTGPVLMIYDSKSSGEASSHAALRLPPFRAGHFKRMIQAFVRGRGAEPSEGGEMAEELRPNDMVLLLDGGRPGNEAAAQASFVKGDGSFMTKQKLAYMLYSDEESFGERRDRIRGFIQQAEGAHLYTRSGPQFQKKDRKHFKGTNKGQVMGPIRMLPWTDDACWRLPPDQKKRVYGKEHIVLVGGAVPEELGDAKIIAFDDHMEPVFYHFNNPLVYAEFLHSYKPSAVVRAPESDHNMAIECIKHQVPLISICLSSAHADLLKNHILKKMWQEFLDENSDLYEGGYVLENQDRHELRAKLLQPDAAAAKGKAKAKATNRKRKLDGEDDAEADVAKKGAGAEGGAGGGSGDATGGENKPKAVPKPKANPGGRPGGDSAAEQARQALLKRLQGAMPGAS
ncbi:unnamed protein product [Symbiodinium sp. CCMP2592]|nr:unnamed protein product [Symbiodinium sp. CCMP2592]